VIKTAEIGVDQVICCEGSLIVLQRC